MPTLVHGPLPPEFEALLERRRRLGQDLFDEQASGSEKAQLVAADEDERVVGVLQDAVDDDVMLGEGLSD